MAGLQYIDVAKSFGPTDVIQRLSLEIDDGAFVAYLGPSGCGKTTLLRLLSGLERVSAGRIEIGGRDVTDSSPKDRNVAMVFQNYALYPHMSVAENIGFGLRVRGMGRAEREGEVRRVAELLGLGALLERKPRALSGGQRQRVAMGRAIVRDPQVFLMDEPLSNLDAQLRTQMRSEIRALQRRLGATMVYVTHDQVEAMSMADRVVVLHGGTIQQTGTPEALFERPANRFVAGFIGAPAMNLIAVEGTEGARSAAGALLPEPLAAAAEIGIRPQHLRLAPGGEDWLMWQGTVEQVEPLGGETLLHLRVGDETLRLRHEGSARTVPGTVVRFGADPACLHAFDARGAALPPA